MPAWAVLVVLTILVGAGLSEIGGAVTLPGAAGIPGPAGAAGVRAGPGPGVGVDRTSFAIAPLSPNALAAGGQGRLFVNSTDPAIVPNTGLRTNITDYYAAPFVPSSAFQVGAEETIGDYVAVFGIFQNDQVFPVPFFSVFSNVTDVTVHLSYWSNLTLVGGQSYDFALARTAGTNWTLTVNGVLFGRNASAATFDFQATAATWAQGIGFSEVAIYSGPLTTPGTLLAPLAFAVQRPSGWYLPQEARGYLVTSDAGWGIEGRAQNGSLAPGQIVSGQSVAPSPNGTVLWAGGPVAVSVGLGLSETSTRGTTIVEASATVVGPTATPLAGVALAFSDDAGASFTPPAGFTDLGGRLMTFIGTPNVSASRSDTIIARVTIFGYIGEASVPLMITPPTQLFLSAAPTAPSTRAGGSVTITVSAQDSTGAPGVGVLLLASVLTGPATVTPFTTTDSLGRATIVFNAPSSPSVVGLTVLVVAPGYWGQLRFNVTVWAEPPSLLLVVAPYLVGAGIALAAVGAILWARSRGKRRPPVPPLRLPAPPEEEVPVSRTLP